MDDGVENKAGNKAGEERGGNIENEQQRVVHHVVHVDYKVSAYRGFADR